MILPDFLLSKNFSFYEMTKTGHTELLEQNRHESVKFVGNMLSFCNLELETARTLFGPMTPGSGFRCPVLNTVVRGSLTSSHLVGLACDYTKPNWFWAQVQDNGSALFDLYRSKGITAKVILEQVDNRVWLHISRHSVLSMYEGLSGIYRQLR